MKPLKSKEYQHTRSLMNPDREYTPAVKTDLAATFARIRREQAEAAKAPVNVRELKRRAK